MGYWNETAAIFDSCFQHCLMTLLKGLLMNLYNQIQGLNVNCFVVLTKFDDITFEPVPAQSESNDDKWTFYVHF